MWHANLMVFPMIKCNSIILKAALKFSFEAPAAMTTSQEKERWSSPRTLEKQIDSAVGNHQTSSSMINAIVGGVSSKGIQGNSSLE